MAMNGSVSLAERSLAMFVIGEGMGEG